MHSGCDERTTSSSLGYGKSLPGPAVTACYVDKCSQPWTPSLLGSLALHLPRSCRSKPRARGPTLLGHRVAVVSTHDRWERQGAWGHCRCADAGFCNNGKVSPANSCPRVRFPVSRAVMGLGCRDCDLIGAHNVNHHGEASCECTAPLPTTVEQRCKARR